MKLTSSELTFQKRFLFITLAVVLISSFLAYHVQTAGGTVKVQAMKIPTQDGQWVVVDLFKPESATAQKPAPLVFVIPGFQRSKEALANVAIELARRSIVAISIDPYAQGFSSASMSTRSATTEGYGLYALVDYFRNTDILNYIDRDRIGATGHSAGGNAVISGASYFGKLAQQTGMPSKLHAVYCSGYVLCMIKNKLKDIRSNVGAAYAFYDEGSYRNELRNADMRFAPEALRLINMSFPDSLEPVQEVEIGHYYGNTDDRTLRVMYNERIIHPFQPYQIEAMANQMEFWDRVLDIDSELSYWNQIWYWKELMGIIAMVASLIALIPLARLLLRTSYFSDLVHPLPPAQPRLTGTGRIIFWGLFVLGALIACFTFIPMAELSKKWFVEASTRHQTWFFPQRMNNAVLLWAILNGSVGFLLFWLSYRFFGKSHGIDPGMWGIKISWRKLRKTFGLAFMLYLFYYLLLGLIYYVLHVDYRFLFMGVRLF
nr:alpha/beta hydrolase [Candidatus Neomarinimicrobiota bacterium]